MWTIVPILGPIVFFLWKSIPNFKNLFLFIRKKLSYFSSYFYESFFFLIFRNFQVLSGLYTNFWCIFINHIEYDFLWKKFHKLFSIFPIFWEFIKNFGLISLNIKQSSKHQRLIKPGLGRNFELLWGQIKAHLLSEDRSF